MMSFAVAFLNGPEHASLEQKVSAHVDVLLTSVSPEADAGADLPHVRGSSLCYGIPMNLALSASQRNSKVRGMLRDRLENFEPRLALLSEITLVEHSDDNSVTFRLTGAVQNGRDQQDVEIEARLSRMDQT